MAGFDDILEEAQRVQAENDPEQQAANIIRERQERAEELGGPVEDQVLGELFDPEAMRRQVLESRGIVRRGFASGRAG